MWSVPLDKKRLNTSGGIPMSMFTDPMQQLMGLGAFGYQEPKRQGGLSWNMLKRMSKNSVIALIIRTRVNQVAAFSQPVHLAKLGSGNALGFEVLNKKKHQNDWSKADKARAAELMDWIANCGKTPKFNEKTGEKRDTFDKFLRKITRDSLSYDQLCFEKVRSRSKELLELWAVDGSTIRIAAKRKDGTTNPEAAYVQVIDAIPRVEYKHDELVFFIRNPRTELEAQGYGYSELEDLIRTITAHLNAEVYNNNLFKKGTTAGGILLLKGANGDELEGFRNQWKLVSSGIANAGSTPVIGVPAEGGGDFISMKQSNKDAEYAKWMEYLITVGCAMFQMDPSEIGFNFKGGMDGQAPLFETSNESRLKASKDKGLRPLLGSISMMMNQEVLEELDPDWFFTFTGIDNKTEEEMIKNRVQELAYKPLDEVRKEGGLDPYVYDPKKPGSILLNPQYLQFLLGQQKAQEAAAAQEQYAMGAGGGEEDMSSFFEEEEVPNEENTEEV